MSEKIAVRVQHKRMTKTQWDSSDVILLEGEIGVESDTGYAKIGDGRSLFKNLKYMQGPQGEAGPTGPQGPQGADGIMRFEDLTPEQKESLNDSAKQFVKDNVKDFYPHNMVHRSYRFNDKYWDVVNNAMRHSAYNGRFSLKHEVNTTNKKTVSTSGPNAWTNLESNTEYILLADIYPKDATPTVSRQYPLTVAVSENLNGNFSGFSEYQSLHSPTTLKANQWNTVVIRFKTKDTTQKLNAQVGISWNSDIAGSEFEFGVSHIRLYKYTEGMNTDWRPSVDDTTFDITTARENFYEKTQVYSKSHMDINFASKNHTHSEYALKQNEGKLFDRQSNTWLDLFVVAENEIPADPSGKIIFVKE